MKKFLSILLSVMMIFTSVLSCSITAFAETTTRHWKADGYEVQDTQGNINGSPSDGIMVDFIKYDTYNGKKGEVYYISYEGKGNLTGWEFPLITEGKDYYILSQKENEITIIYFNDKYLIFPFINALVDFDETTKSATINKTTTKSTQSENITTSENVTISTTVANETNSTNQQDNSEINVKSDNKNVVIVVASTVLIVIALVIIVSVINKKKRR